MTAPDDYPVIPFPGSDTWEEGWRWGLALDASFPEQDADEFAAACANNTYGPLVEGTSITAFVMLEKGENDERDWAWLVTLSNGEVWYARGGCDYTGWDCPLEPELVGPMTARQQVASGAPSTAEPVSTVQIETLLAATICTDNGVPVTARRVTVMRGRRGTTAHREMVRLARMGYLSGLGVANGCRSTLTIVAHA